MSYQVPYIMIQKWHVLGYLIVPFLASNIAPSAVGIAAVVVAVSGLSELVTTRD